MVLLKLWKQICWRFHVFLGMLMSMSMCHVVIRNFIKFISRPGTTSACLTLSLLFLQWERLRYNSDVYGLFWTTNNCLLQSTFSRIRLLTSPDMNSCSSALKYWIAFAFVMRICLTYLIFKIRKQVLQVSCLLIFAIFSPSSLLLSMLEFVVDEWSLNLEYRFLNW